MEKKLMNVSVPVKFAFASIFVIICRFVIARDGLGLLENTGLH